MNKKKHGDGPWKTSRGNGADWGAERLFRVVWSEATGIDVAYCTQCGDYDLGNANALLISCAPELLLACEELEQYVSSLGDGKNDYLILAMARRVIAKARGE